MPDWIVWLVVGFIVYRFCMAGSRCGRRVTSSRYSGHESDRELARGHGTPIAMRRDPGIRAGRTTETPIQAAQRRFVEGATTVEEYEAEVDRALRERGSSRGDVVTEPAPRTSRL